MGVIKVQDPGATLPENLDPDLLAEFTRGFSDTLDLLVRNQNELRRASRAERTAELRLTE